MREYVMSHNCVDLEELAASTFRV